jgi:hypothetical protein
MRDQIFALRKDPAANSLMAGAFANSNAKVLTERLGRKPTDGELYIAHFLGASGAVRLISGAQTQPNVSAASLFPKAAAANTSIFYDKSGNARSLSQVYGVLIAKHDAGATRLAMARIGAPAAATVAPTPATPATPAPAAPPLIAAAVPTSPVAPAAQVAQATQNVPLQRVASGPIFHALYNDGNRGAVAPVVRELWGVRHGMPPTTVTVMEPVAPAAPQAPARPPLSLFQFLRPDARGAA